MNLLSRLKKGKKSAGADSQTVAGVDADVDEEGLLMPTVAGQPSADSGGNSQADGDALLAAAESGGEGGDEGANSQVEVDAMRAEADSSSGDSEGSTVSDEDDDLPEAAQSDVAEGEDDADGLMAAAQAPPDADEIDPEEPAEGDPADDDPLSAFKGGEVHSDLADMTKDIEEIAIADLLEQVRDVRGMLPAAPAEDEDAA